MRTYKNPRRMSTSALYSSLEEMRDAARAVQRQFQRSKSQLYYAAYEEIAAENRQKYGQAILPKKLPSDRSGMEEYYRTAQRLLNLESVPNAKREVRELAAKLRDTIKQKTATDENPDGLDIFGKTEKFGRKEQKVLSEFMHSDEWKAVYSFGSEKAIKHLGEIMHGINLSEPTALKQLKSAFEAFRASDADLQTDAAL